MSGTESGDRGRPATAAARRHLAASSAIAATLVCGLLIWAKLRLVTDIPRTAYANPERGVDDANVGREGDQALPDEAFGATAGVPGE